MTRRGFAHYMEYERGFRGWLVFFFVTICLSALLRAYIVFQTSRMLSLVVGSGHGTLIGSVAAQLVVGIGLLAAECYGIKHFADQDRRTPRYWSAFFLAAVVLQFCNYALIAYQTTFYNDVSFSSALRDTVRDGGLRGMVVSLAWALYWMRSRRVQLTYGTKGFERALTRPVPERSC
jgi:hypothetical protein